jgi:WD40 repeat protein
VRIWDTTIGEELKEYRIEPAHAFAIYGLALSPDGKWIVTCGADDQVKAWDMAMDRPIILQPRHPSMPSCVAFRPDGKLLASASVDGTIKLWETQSWKQQGEDLRDSTGGVYNMAFSADGRLLAWGSTDANVKMWDARTKEIHRLLAQAFVLAG